MGDADADDVVSLAGVRHYCFLVHGWLGDDSEMTYLADALNRCLDGKELVVVHRTVCNNGRTNDGVALGGSRLADEVRETVRMVMDEKNHDVTISFVGNSLGGLYARYAVGELHADEREWKFNVFCTTATPHLGCSSHTYVPLPRFAEQGLSVAFGRTGRDLFRNHVDETDDVVRRMGLDETYLVPLSRFRRRIAYANTFQTDFQVPTDTAAFLSPHSSWPHTIITRPDHKEAPFVVAALETKPKDDLTNDGDRTGVVHDDNDDCRISQSLDALGWRKVFCDVRDLLPLPNLRLPFVASGPSRCETLLDQRQTGGVVTSRALLSSLAPASADKFPLIPLGHTVMVANAKNSLYRRINGRGTVVMDYLAKELIDEMLKYDKTSRSDEHCS